MEDILDLVTINSDTMSNPERTSRVLSASSFPYRIKDMTLPQCNTGYVYMLISIKDMNFIHIGKTMCIRTRIQQHNSDDGSMSTQPPHLRPYALFAYICGVNSRNDLLFYLERIWKEFGRRRGINLLEMVLMTQNHGHCLEKSLLIILMKKTLE